MCTPNAAIYLQDVLVNDGELQARLGSARGFVKRPACLCVLTAMLSVTCIAESFNVAACRARQQLGAGRWRQRRQQRRASATAACA